MYISPDVDVGTGGSWVELPVQRRLCLIFVGSVGSPVRGLTGCQRTPGFWAVTTPFEIPHDPIDQLAVYYKRHPKRHIKTSSCGIH